MHLRDAFPSCTIARMRNCSLLTGLSLCATMKFNRNFGPAFGFSDGDFNFGALQVSFGPFPRSIVLQTTDHTGGRGGARERNGERKSEGETKREARERTQWALAFMDRSDSGRAA